MYPAYYLISCVVNYEYMYKSYEIVWYLISGTDELSYLKFKVAESLHWSSNN
jgi:hypothetical protein